MISSFDTFNLNQDLISGLEKESIVTPTKIQAKAIPLALENKDIICQSETGSGKTLAYLLPIMQRIDTEKKAIQAIVLTPTHELAMQIDHEIKLLAKNSNMNITSATIIGKANIKRQIENLRQKPHIIVGSTGRIFEIIKMKKINAQTVKTIVIDEGDKLLDSNNLNGVKDVIKTTLRDRQLMVFSATITDNTIEVAKELMKDPQVIKIQAEKTINPDISHIYIPTELRDKISTLRKIVAAAKPEKAIIFINRSENIETTTSKLNYHHLNACGIYGTASKEERRKAIEGFRTGKYKLLVASDLAARGLDVKGVTHIINLDLPEEPDEYLHRVGRTGRAGKTGLAISIVTPRELDILKKYQNKFKITIKPKELSRGTFIDPDSQTFKPKANTEANKNTKEKFTINQDNTSKTKSNNKFKHNK